MHLDPDDLALLALRENTLSTGGREHLTICRRCQQDYIDLFEIAELGRDADTLRGLPVPPAHIWDAIFDELLPPSLTTRTAGDALSRRSGSARTRSRHARYTSTRDRVRVAALAAAAAVVAVAGTLGITAALRLADRPVAAADLTAQAAAPPSAGGTARLVHVGSSTQLRVTISGLPLPMGYYEAWLFDPATGTMYPIGPVAAGGGTLTVTGVDLRRYTGVDISAQPVNGTGGHAVSVLRGTLR